MSNPVSFANTFHTAELHENAVRGNSVKAADFFIYRSEEILFPEQFFQPTRSKDFIILLNLGEVVQLQYNLIHYVLEKNALFIIHPGVMYAFEKSSRLPTISLGFSHDFLNAAMVHKRHLQALGSLVRQNDPLFELSQKEGEAFLTLMLYLKDRFIAADLPFKEDMVHHGFNLFLLELAAVEKKYRLTEEHGMTRKDDILFQFLEKLAAHFKEERSVQFYADALFMTPKHLTKTVKELTTKTCGEFIDEMVIAEAKILLGDLAYSVGQVADALHFSDQFFFSKFFKRRTGLSPKEYRNSL